MDYIQRASDKGMSSFVFAGHEVVVYYRKNNDMMEDST